MKPIRRSWKLALISVPALFASMGTVLGAGPVRVVSTLPDYASIAQYLGGELVSVESIAAGFQDAHFVSAKPSFARMMADADLFLTTGLDLELWAPSLIDKSRNPRIREGANGYVSVSTGMPLLDIPKNPNRAGGDIHIYGNPHIHTEPLRGLVIARNILVGLEKVDPAHSTSYRENFERFKEETHRRLFGEELVRLVGGDQLSQLAWKHQLDAFLDGNQFDGKSLRDYLGGWFKQAECLRGKEIVAYHKNWIYFSDRFGIDIIDYVEDKPGIPASARHVVELIDLMVSRQVRSVFAANYHDESAPRKIAEKTGANAVVVPISVGGTPQAKSYFDLFDIWIRSLKRAYPECS